MQTAVSIVALVLSALSLGWQAATFVMTGGRVKVELRVGAMDQAGINMVTAPSLTLSEEWARRYREQGYVRPVFAVRVRSTGRGPVTVEQWSLVVLDEVGDGASLASSVAMRARRTELAELTSKGEGSIGPQLPHRFEAGSPSVTWAVAGEEVARVVNAAKATFKRNSVPIVGKVELGNGRTYYTDEILRL